MEKRNVVGLVPALLVASAIGATTWSLSPSIPSHLVCPLRLYAIIAGFLALVFLAGLFLTARNTTKISKAEAAKTEAFRIAILGFVEEGGELFGRWKADDSDELEEETSLWGGRVVAYLDSLGDKSKSAFFVSEQPVPFTQYASSRIRPSRVQNWIQRRIHNLNQLTKASL